MMKIIIYPLFLLCFFTYGLKAQNQSDSLNIEITDSTKKETNTDDDGLTNIQFEDTINQRIVVMSFEREKLKTIYYQIGLNFLGCERVVLHINNDSLAYAEYTITDPDIRSSLPPSTTYTIYFRNDQQIGNDTNSRFAGPIVCTGFSPRNIDFIKEFYYYKKLAVNIR